MVKLQKGKNMKATEMKQILFEKLQDERTGFKKSDISIKSENHGHKITIKGYEHITFSITTEEDDYFGYIVNIDEHWFGTKNENIAFKCSKYGYDYRSALLRLGYHIANTF